MAKKAKEQPQEQAAEGGQFAIQRLYIKDSSYEAPNSPEILREQWEPQADINVNTASNEIEKDIYEVVLTITLTTKVKDKVAFLVEVQQAGIFTIKDFPSEDKDHLLRAYCSGILFPYARQHITDIVVDGGFPPIYLAPINFEAVYMQEKQKQKEGAKS